MNETLLDIGAGSRPNINATCMVDFQNYEQIGNIKSVKWDLRKFPYPFKDNSFDVVYSRCFLEHIENPIKVMNEMYRIAKKKVIVIVPHYSSQTAYVHIEHKNRFSSGSFSTFYEGDMNEGGIRWKGKGKVTLSYADGRKWLRWLNPFYNWLININPVRTDRYFLSFVFGGIEFMKFEFDIEGKE